MWEHRKHNISFYANTDDDMVVEPTTTTTTTPPSIKQEEESQMIDSMLENNKMNLLMDCFEPELVEEEEEEEDAPSKPKSVQSLFEYLKSDFLDTIRLDYDEIYETFRARAPRFETEIQEDKAIITEIIDCFVSRMVLNLITLDKVAFKVEDMIEKVEALYYESNKRAIEHVKNDFQHYDYINKIITERCRDSLEPATDKIYERLSVPKPRGRRSKQRPEEKLNEIETIAGDYITPKKQPPSSPSKKSPREEESTESSISPSRSLSQKQPNGANTIDYYPIFTKTLQILNKSIPRVTNHGLYLENLIQYIRTLDSSVWPLHGFVSLVNNMNYCVYAQRTVLDFETEKKRFYCCYSGLPLKPGETVTWLKVVENDAERLREWHADKLTTGRPFEAPEFLRSVASFYMKTDLCCTTSLFYTPFTERYQSHFPEYFDKTKKPLPAPIQEKRRRKATPPASSSKPILSDIKCESTLFDSLASYDTPKPSLFLQAMLGLHRTLKKLSAHQVTCHEKKWREERNAFYGVFDKVDSEGMFLDIAQKLLFYSAQCHSSECPEDPHALMNHSEKDVALVLDFAEALQIADHETTYKNKLLIELAKLSKFRARLKGQKNHFVLGASSLDEAVMELAMHADLTKYSLLFVILFEYIVKHHTVWHTWSKSIKPTRHMACLLALFKIVAKVQ